MCFGVLMTINSYLIGVDFKREIFPPSQNLASKYGVWRETNWPQRLSFKDINLGIRQQYAREFCVLGTIYVFITHKSLCAALIVQSLLENQLFSIWFRETEQRILRLYNWHIYSSIINSLSLFARQSIAKTDQNQTCFKSISPKFVYVQCH